ncbi:hypothetical protein [Gloeobacter violaceus]|uniref:Glr1817 protein n=1 Tax=Gloeobacter violaceus (strain ATCC 29082 / PCC 7421) TaxID=251221 RepID=Q7NJL5_GLOVI|nr:hypothetical protein [Gloeobacter violaceus]BAC89758.1 glr1817 [Gloeobacter violaceus PCC 7421]
MKLSDLTAIGRPVDPSYPTNRTIALIAGITAVGGSVIQLFLGAPWLQSALWGFTAGISVFLAWAIARELDPDRDLSAFVAAGLAIVGTGIWGLPNLGILLWLMLVVRVVNRTTGLSVKWSDSLAVLALGGWLAFQGNWAYAALTAVALWLDSRLPPANRPQVVFAGLGVVLTLVVLAWGEAAPAAGVSFAAGALAVGLAAVFLPVGIGSGRLVSVGDEDGEALVPIRVQAAQALALSVGIETALWGGAAGLSALTPFWAAVVGTAAYRWLRAFTASR